MKAFSLIELIVVFAIVGIITAVSISSFAMYSNFQQFQTSVSEFSNFLSATRSKAISQVKPAVCVAGALEGYKVSIISDSIYQQDVLCGGISYILAKKNLNSSIRFATESTSNIIFDVSTGTVPSPGSFVITGMGSTNTVVVDKIGNISTINAFIVTAAPTPTPLACSKDYWYIAPSYCILVGGNFGQYCDASCGGQVGGIPTSTPTPPIVPTPTPTPVVACSKNYNLFFSFCYFAGTGAGTYCDAACTITN